MANDLPQQSESFSWLSKNWMNTADIDGVEAKLFNEALSDWMD